MAKESTTEKVPVHCECKKEQMWCLTRCCVCVKAEVKCSIVSHGGKNVHYGLTFKNKFYAGTQGQNRLKIQNKKNKAKEGQGRSKQQCKDTVGKLVKSRK